MLAVCDSAAARPMALLPAFHVRIGLPSSSAQRAQPPPVGYAFEIQH
jgi:hypothetical protein